MHSTYPLLFVVSLMEVVISRLTLTSPPSLASQYQNGINYSISNFGTVPYGRTLSGQILLPNITQQPNYEFCNVTALAQLNNTFDERYVQHKWYIVRRGGCSFTMKVRNAQRLGASLVLIVDNVNEVVQQIVMSDDGQGYQIHIPSVLIGQQDGNAIFRQLESGSNDTVSGLMVFNDTSKQERVSALLGLSIQNRETFVLLRQFKQYYDKLKNDVNFDIFYELLTCWHCRFNNFSTEIPNCLGGGRYCQLQPDSSSSGSGQDVVREQLRQSCLWTVNQEKWWNYMLKFDTECLKPVQYSECFERLNDAATYQKVEECVIKSYNTSSNSNQKIQQNLLLDNQLQYKFTSGVVFYPGVVINNVTYRGNIDAFEIFEDICSGMLNPTQTCRDSDIQTDEAKAAVEQDSSYVALICFIIAVCIVFMLFMVFIYRRMLRREMQKEMGQQVNQMVSQYISFYESKTEH